LPKRWSEKVPTAQVVSKFCQLTMPLVHKPVSGAVVCDAVGNNVALPMACLMRMGSTSRVY
jgi:hypothetical protein